jgi:hypothetical protein
MGSASAWFALVADKNRLQEMFHDIEREIQFFLRMGLHFVRRLITHEP